jgi:LAO/AO transport system kinase
MQRHFEDPEVFIRSVATRGALGGLSRSTVDIARVLEAWRADAILIETVGVGQDELEVTRAAHSTLVVMAPGMGDDIQAIKAGILECADVFAVNKADRPGADATMRDLEVMLALGDKMLTSVSHSHSHSHSHSAARPAMAVAERDSWRPPIVKCVATRGEGVEQVLESLKAHREWLLGTEAGRARRSARLREQLLGTLRDEIAEAVANQLGALVDETAEKIERREIDPYSALEALTEAFRGAAAPRE